MLTTTSCPDSTTLERLLTGLLPEAETCELAAHLEVCESCTNAAGELVSSDSLTALLAEPAAKVATVEVPKTVNLHAPSLAVTPIPPETPREFPEFDPPSRPGDLGRLGPYRLIDKLGSGGMGIVFRGEDTALNRPVAVKVLQKQFAHQGTAKARFLREARAAASVAGDHVVKIFQVGEIHKVPFIAMELLQGESLADRLRLRGPASAGEVLEVGRGIATGLAAAHAAGVLHRDIKPANVWLEAGSGRVKLLDFGLAKPFLGADLTAPGEVAGTPSYVSPEQAAGRDIDARSDLFSLGIVLYELATGTKPFPGETAWAALTALANTKPPRPRSLRPSLPPALDALIMRLLSKNPAGRPKSADDVSAELQAIAAAPFGASSRRLWAVLLGLVAIAACATLWLLFQPSPTPETGSTQVLAEPREDESVSPIWADDFEADLGAWKLKYAAANSPSGIAEMDGRKALHLVPKADSPANAYRELGTTANPLTIIAKVRYAALPPLSAKYGWRFQINLKSEASAGAAGRNLTGDESVLPGRWAEVRIRYGSVGFLTEVAVWVDDVPMSYAISPMSLNERSLTILELVAGHQDVWFDDVRVLTPEPTEASRAWSTAMALAAGEPSEANAAKLLSVAETLASGTKEDRRLASAARRFAASIRPERVSTLTIQNDRRSVRSAAFTSDGRAVVTAGGDGLVRVWDAVDGSPRTSWGTTRSILPCVVVLPDDTVIAPADGTGKLQAWDLAGTPKFDLTGHTGQVTSLAVAEGGTLFSAARDGTLRRWDITTRTSRETLETFGRLNEFNLVSSASGTVLAWDGERKTAKLNGVELVPSARAVLAISPDGKRLLGAGGNGALQSWSTADRALTVTMPDAGKTATCAAYSPDGLTWAIGRMNGVIELRDGVTLELLARYTGHTDRVYSVAFSRDGRRIVSGSQDNSLRFWNAATLPSRE
jgi:serine/threonine protein kinase/WD40 repeat protein